METDRFITLCKKWFKKTQNTYDFSIGKDMHINTKLTIDDDGFIWIRACESFKRIKTTVNVSNIVEFRLSDFDSNCFYIICSDNSGFEVHQSEIYYCIDGQPSGFGDAVSHFEKFPDGIVKK